ncbi:MAG: NAD(P)-dependent dehydrogenase (short-subunit alcohol dehydrogenase family) [Arcticibacterium sp.]|jgi:NAD(P)-dependent dehydrogenase (short-subunit alcohol dehydrogenase family)
MFDIEKIPSQKGRLAIITGANIGLGYETALALAKKEMSVILACRSLEKAEVAKQKILGEVPKAHLEIMQIDLSSLKSVRAFATSFLKKYKKLDLLINNAGVMIPPYSQTEDGFELQMGANYFGHFLLTGLLLDIIEKTPESRIVSLSSIAHKSGKINFDDLQSEKNYSKMEAYSQSKLACLMYAFELQKRLDKKGSKTLSVAAHPGVSNTNLSQHIPKILQLALTPLFMFMVHKPASAAQPTLLAALGKDVKGGQYFGPTGFREMNGEAGLARFKSFSKDEAVAKHLWETSEKLTDIKYI